MSRARTLLEIIDFFVPIEVLTSVLLVFVGEMIFERVVGEVGLLTLLCIYVSGVVITSILRYLSADDEERAELQDDIDDL